MVKDAMRIKASTPQSTGDVVDKEGEQVHRNPFTSQTLMEALKEFAEKLGKENRGRLLAANIKNNTPEKRSDEAIVLTLDHIAVEREFQEYRSELLTWLKLELKNDYLTLDYEVRKVHEQEATAKPFTNRERIEVLARKNPNLVQLMKKLDLDVDL